MYTLKIANNFIIIIVFILSTHSCTKQQDNIFDSDEDDANNVWFNDGFGTFTDSGLSLGTANSRGVELGDVDDDGDMDDIDDGGDCQNDFFLRNFLK